jgi:hypothetical protein
LLAIPEAVFVPALLRPHTIFPSIDPSPVAAHVLQLAPDCKVTAAVKTTLSGVFLIPCHSPSTSVACAEQYNPLIKTRRTAKFRIFIALLLSRTSTRAFKPIPLRRQLQRMPV